MKSELQKATLAPTPVNEQLKTHFFRVRALVQAKALGRGDMIKVILHNPFFQADNVTPNAIEVMIGDGSQQILLLIPGQSSPEIYAEDLKDIYLKVRTGAVETDIVCLCYRTFTRTE